MDSLMKSIVVLYKMAATVQPRRKLGERWARLTFHKCVPNPYCPMDWKTMNVAIQHTNANRLTSGKVLVSSRKQQLANVKTLTVVTSY